MVLREYNVSLRAAGRSTSQEIWIFGLADPSHTPDLGYMEIVPDRTAATLLPTIQAHVAPGTIIHSDEYRIGTLPNVYTQVTVNHSIESCHGVHTQNIESYWNRSKIKLKQMRGCHASELASYLDEFMWWERYGTTAGAAYRSITADIAAFILCNSIPLT